MSEFVVIWHKRGRVVDVFAHSVVGPFLNAEDAREWARNERLKRSADRYAILEMQAPSRDAR